jgi:hypothetical protein
VTSKEIDLSKLEESHDFGIKRFSDALYKGEIRFGKRHGLGIMKYTNGRLYEGHWDKDVRTGRGFEKYDNENSYLGEF